MNSSKRLFIVYPLLVILILVGVFSVTTEFSYAAETFDVSHGTRWVQGENIDSGLRIKTNGGSTAYCLNQGSASPSGAYTDKLSLSAKLKAVLYYGYPNNTKFGTTTLTADQARCATQLAVWAHDNSGKGNKIDLNKLHGANDKKPEGDQVLTAAKWLYKKANSGYTAPGTPSFANPKITQPANKTPQYFNNTYVRIGPYKFTTTSNSYTSGNKTTVKLDGSPSGTVLGDVYGNNIATPTAGKDFYIYIPSEALNGVGSGHFSMNISYNYKYEKAATFTAYKKDSTQNVAVSTKKEFASGSKKVDGKNAFKWTRGEMRKVDSADSGKGIPNTEFNLYVDQASNGNWQFMHKAVTDVNGIIRIPGMGTGTYKLVETKPNPNYALNSETGGSDEVIFNISSVDTEAIQVMTNNLIKISCQVDKDTIKKTSAAYKSLPDQEGIDNTGSETYRYHVDYRSTANVWADEFTVDDPLEGVVDGKIRVTELWTPISYGDNDGKMNIWYKTNKTEDGKSYSNVNAVGSNPDSPNNPNKAAVKKNTGYKLWKNGVSTTSRTHLEVSELGLEDDEYITALRLEHGRVKKGFTTRNYAYESVNDESVVDWTPKKSDQFFTNESAEAKGLKPLTYLVMCPEPLTPSAVINNSADSFIARNIHLTDDDKDQVVTEVIDTFKENPVDEEIKPVTKVMDKDGKVLGEMEEVTSKTALKHTELEKGKGVEVKTGDLGRPGWIVVIMLGALICLAVMFLFKKKHKAKILPVILAAMILAGSFSAGGDVFAGRRVMEDEFDVNGLEYYLVDAKKSFFQKGTAYDVSYEVSQVVDSKGFDSVGQQNMLPQNLDVEFEEYRGKITLSKESVEPMYIKKQAQIDKTEVIKNLDIEDISDLPTSKSYSVRSDESVDATVKKDLKRAGVSLKVSGRDKDGIPDKWDATIVYRGLESFLEKYRYNVQATYEGKVSKAAKPVKADDKVREVQSVASLEEKDYNDLTPEEAEQVNQEIAKKKYLEAKGYNTPEPEAESSEPQSDGWKTSDYMKLLGLLVALVLGSFLVFTIVSHRRRNQR